MMREIEFLSREMHLKALESRPASNDSKRMSANRVLALHGWLDNAESFRTLTEQIPEAHLISLDLPGHGRSDHKCKTGTYNLTDDLMDILNVVDQLEWGRVHLLGHSRGAMISTLFAAVFPDRVASLTLLDGLVPLPTPASDFIAQLRKHLDQFRIGAILPPRTDLNDVVQMRMKKNQLSHDEVEAMCRRGTLEKQEGIVWSCDPRLMYASSMKLGEKQNTAVLEAIQCNTLLVLFSRGMGAEENIRQLAGRIDNCQLLEIDGCHHAHMQLQHAATIAEEMKRFWEQ